MSVSIGHDDDGRRPWIVDAVNSITPTMTMAERCEERADDLRILHTSEWAFMRCAEYDVKAQLMAEAGRRDYGDREPSSGWDVIDCAASYLEARPMAQVLALMMGVLLTIGLAHTFGIVAAAWGRL